MKYKAKEGVSHFYSRFNSLNIVIMFKCKWYIGFMTHFENKWIYLLKYFTILFDIRWNWDMAIYTDIHIYSKYSRQKPASLHHQLINAWRTLLEKIHDIQMTKHTPNNIQTIVLIGQCWLTSWNSDLDYKTMDVEIHFVISKKNSRHKTFANIL